MNEEQTKAIRELRDAGFAVTVFTPEELAEVDPTRVEDRMVECGWDAIDFLNPNGVLFS